MVRTSRRVMASRRGSGGVLNAEKYGMTFACTPGISPRRMAIPTRAEVKLFETDCIVCSSPCFQ